VQYFSDVFASYIGRWDSFLTTNMVREFFFDYHVINES